MSSGYLQPFFLSLNVLISIASKKWLVKWFPNHWLWRVRKVACEVSISHAATHQLPHMPWGQPPAITNAILNNNPCSALESPHMGYLLLWGILSSMDPPITSVDIIRKVFTMLAFKSYHLVELDRKVSHAMFLFYSLWPSDAIW